MLSFLSPSKPTRQEPAASSSSFVGVSSSTASSNIENTNSDEKNYPINSGKVTSVLSDKMNDANLQTVLMQQLAETKLRYEGEY